MFATSQIHGGVGPTAERRHTYLETLSPSRRMVSPQHMHASREGRIQSVVLARDLTSHFIANNAGSFAPSRHSEFIIILYYVVVVLLSHNK